VIQCILQIIYTLRRMKYICVICKQNKSPQSVIASRAQVSYALHVLCAHGLCFCCWGISQFYLHTHTFIHERDEIIAVAAISAKAGLHSSTPWGCLHRLKAPISSTQWTPTRSTQPPIPPGSVNENQLRLRSKQTIPCDALASCLWSRSISQSINQ